TYRVAFDAADLASGLYFYQLRTERQTLTRSMLLLK
ncbi:MAG: peptidase S8, partial [Bacteroidetes bacterium]